MEEDIKATAVGNLSEIDFIGIHIVRFNKQRFKINMRCCLRPPGTLRVQVYALLLGLYAQSCIGLSPQALLHQLAKKAALLSNTDAGTSPGLA
jgi:hypothetical protein